MPTASDRDWLGWTEADYIQLALVVHWADEPTRQAFEDAQEFLRIVYYCTYRAKSA